ncbi:carbon starvation protein A [Candidatus Pacearchaeota archaeon]|nr:carbon starvation protein A [Candidatus Pacearchaeota archaeon]
MNSIWIVLIVGLWFFLGYKFYARFIEKKLRISDANKTPAVSKRDDVDFSPAKKPLLIGHHFESIAGAGPIIGPILAISYFGWLPVVLWVSLGSVLIGAVHDFTSLVASARNKGEGVSKIAKKTLSSKAGTLFAVMIFITLILIITVFSVSTAESIVYQTGLIISLVVITITALVFGYGVEKLKWDYRISTFISMIVVFFSVWLGVMFPIDLSFVNPVLLRNIVITIIMLYAGIASIVPVWLLLRPRDYLSTIQTSLILLLGIVSILIVHPKINAPAYISNSPFPLWPILFITVACGAVSGFHGIVASGTTSKQIAKESHAKSVGYGSMLGEATVAIIVTIVAIAGLKWGIGDVNFQTQLSKGWIALFSTGFGNIVGSVGIPLITIAIAGFLGSLAVNQIILTSVDTSTRLGRYIVSESLIPKLSKNKIFVTAAILIPAWLLAVTNSYEVLWKLFGTSNQLTAAITMITVSSYFVSKGIKVKFIVVPALFVLVTTMFALLYLTFRTGGYFFTGNYVLSAISVGMFFLGLLVAKEGFERLRNKK